MGWLSTAAKYVGKAATTVAKYAKPALDYAGAAMGLYSAYQGLTGPDTPGMYAPPAPGQNPTALAEMELKRKEEEEKKKQRRQALYAGKNQTMMSTGVEEGAKVGAKKTLLGAGA